ncbi:unnamed protein product [Prorocentrum cordatum]|nr:unnamed protein product [Polarella glacialis]
MPVVFAEGAGLEPGDLSQPSRKTKGWVTCDASPQGGPKFFEPLPDAAPAPRPTPTPPRREAADGAGGEDAPAGSGPPRDKAFSDSEVEEAPCPAMQLEEFTDDEDGGATGSVQELQEERHLVAARMREGKAWKQAAQKSTELADLKQRYADVALSNNCEVKGGNKWRRKLSLAAGQEVYEFGVAMPPLIVASTAASQIFKVLYTHPMLARIWRGINVLMQKAVFTVSLGETDAAMPNQMLSAVQFANVAAGAAEFSREVCQYMMCNYMRFAVTTARKHHWLANVGFDGDPGEDTDADQWGADIDDDREFKHKGFDAYVKSLRELRAVMNGCWWSPYAVQHFCSGACECTTLAEHVAKLAPAITKTVLHHMPLVPSVNKWTKLGPCVDVLVFGLLAHRVLPVCFESLKFKAPPSRDDHEADDQFKFEADFSALQGKRFRLALDMLKSEASVGCIVMLGIVLEPVRHVSAWLMRRARECPDPCGRPAVLDFFNDRFNPVVHARQYISTLLSGRATRLVLLWRIRQRESLQDWFGKHPEDIRLFRRLLLALDCALFRRHYCPSRRFPWGLVRLCDDRFSAAEREQLAEKFFRTPECCLHPGFARKVASALASSRELLTEKWLARLRVLVRVLTLQVADVEWRHGRVRAPNPKDLFILDFHAGCTARDERVNPVLQDTKDRIDREFAELTPEAVAEYGRQDRAGEHFSSLLESCQCGTPRCRHWALAANLNAAEPEVEHLESDKFALFTGAAQAIASRAPTFPSGDYPLTVPSLKRALKSNTLSACEAEFREVTNGYVLAPPRFQFPERVAYPKCCGALCSNTNSLSKARAYLRLLAGFASFSAKFKPADLPEQDLLLLLHGNLGSGASILEYAFFPHAAGRFCHHPPEQTFVRLEAAGDGDQTHVIGLELKVPLADGPAGARGRDQGIQG